MKTVVVQKGPFIINRYLEIKEEIQIDTPFSVFTINNGLSRSAVQIFSLPVDLSNKEDTYYKNFTYLVSRHEQIKEETKANIPKIISSGITHSGSFPFIETEHIDGDSINAIMHQERFIPLSEIARLAEQISRTLAYCHNADIIHGNITDKNIVLERSRGNYMLTCFGLSVFPPEHLNKLIKEKGRIYAIAPEQMNGQLIYQTDIYQFGYVLYTSLTN